jgi:hypothetical protein
VKVRYRQLRLFAPLMASVFASSQGSTPAPKWERPAVVFAEQTFSEDELATITKDVLHALSGDEIVVRCVKSKELGMNNYAHWFVARGIHLHNSTETDLYIRPRMQPGSPKSDKSESGCWDGGVSLPLWTLRKTERGFRVVLSTGADDFQVLPSRSHGIRDIALTWDGGDSSNTVTFQFDGKRYIQKIEPRS